MSTDAGARGRAGFGRTLGIVLAVLAVLAGALVAVAAATPPRVSSVAVAPDSLVARPGQRVVIALDQPVSPEGLAVSVVPDTPVELTADGASLQVRFERMLDYATEYAITIEGVRSTATGASGRVQASFRTPDEDVLVLARGAGGDQVVRAAATSAAAPAAVYSAQQIGAFARLGDDLVVVSDEGEGPRVRHLRTGAQPFVFGGPPDAIYRGLRTAPDGRSFGYLLTSANVGPDATVYDSVLQLVDAATDIATEVVAADGRPIPVADWRYIAGTTSILVRSMDQQGYLIDTTGGEPVPLGTLGTLRGFVPGTATILTDQWPDTLATDLTTGETARFERPAVPLEGDDALGDFAALGPDETAQLVHVFETAGGRTSWTSSYLVRTGPEGVAELFRPAAGMITGMCASPNAQLLALTVVEVATPDAAPLTYIVDSRSGATVRTVTGGQSDWCAA